MANWTSVPARFRKPMVLCEGHGDQDLRHPPFMESARVGSLNGLENRGNLIG
jgi:hypothetical protein